MTGRTDGKIKKRVAKYAAEVTARAELAVQLYLSGASEEAQKMLAQIDKHDDNEETSEDETVSE
jgi:thioredoxin-like negative regulator of GroEL